MRTLIIVCALSLAATARAETQQQTPQPAQQARGAQARQPGQQQSQPAQGQQQSQQAARPAPCAAPEFRQFDFWIGEWAVANADGREQGRSHITREAGGCAINEHWQGAGGVPGVSINYFDRRDGKWHQHWVGGGGAVLHLAGNFDGKAMVMTGESDTPQGRVRNRITWTPLADGRVSQQWDTSADGGKTWRTTFLGYYTRRAAAKAEGK